MPCHAMPVARYISAKLISVKLRVWNPSAVDRLIFRRKARARPRTSLGLRSFQNRFDSVRFAGKRESILLGLQSAWLGSGGRTFIQVDGSPGMGAFRYIEV